MAYALAMIEHTGKVYLVGAGPGDPGLITVRGRELLGIADVVLHDELANPVFRRWAPRAQWLYVGKHAGSHSLQQEEINDLLVAQAREHPVVVRLKGGDPFVFGRGGEEALALARAGIPFEVVPGVTAGIAAPAYSGIPVTHRGIANAVTFITAHGAASDDFAGLDRIALDGTLCFYMGVARLPEVVRALLDLGRAPDTPAAVIESGTYARQRVVSAPLQDLAERAAADRIAAPALIVVGAVADLREHIAWFEHRPLFGLRAVLTPGPSSPGMLEQHLRAMGAAILALPAFEVAPSDDMPEPFAIDGYDWILLTSPNAAEALFDNLERQQLDARALAGTRLCAVGKATAAAVERRHLRIDAQPESYEPEAVRAALRGHGELQGTRILVPRADLTRRAATGLLEDAGATVVEAAAYRTRPPEFSREHAQGLLDFAPHLVVFTNSAAVRHFAAMLGDRALADLRPGTAFASIGPVTTQALERLGLPVAVEPLRHDAPHLAEAISTWWAGQAPGETAAP